jgi:diguanylate cyclase (GGDEF)-like protein
MLGTTDADSWEIISLRFGVALLALGPLTLSEIERDRRYAIENLKELATQDSLTSVMNRRAFDHAADEIIERVRRTRRPLTILMIDVDHFKLLNDTHGHLAGDLVLSRLANIVSMSMPANAVVGRVGGEEFAAIVPYLERAQAHELAEGIRSRIEAEAAYGSAHHTFGATVSIGVSWGPPGKDATFHDLMESADRALYEAKRFGRNQVVLATAPEAGSTQAVASAQV